MSEAESAQIDALVWHLIQRFASDMNDAGASIPMSTFAAVKFAAHVAATSICHFADDPVTRDKGLQLLIDAFTEHAKRCVCECSPRESVH